MRRLATALGLVFAGVAACDADEATRYLDDGAFRRATLTASLVNPANAYSQLRLDHYGRDWDALPEYNPASAALRLDDPDLGAAAFGRYPVQRAPDDVSQGVVEVTYADGSRGRALTCASCHARSVQGALVMGLANQTIDLGWGPGRIDVAPAPGDEPLAIPDLRPIAWQTHLHRAGAITVEAAPLATLAIRIETLIVTSHGGVLRPPRAIALALARYLHSLAPPSREVETRGAFGRALFDATCASCHRWPSLAGPIFDAATIGTDDRAARSWDRGTGGYRAPSLYGVATRGRLLHDGSVADLDALLDPARPQAGHRYGTELSPTDRAALLAFLALL